MVQPRQDMPPDDGDVLVRLPEQQRVQHPVVDLYSLVFAGGHLVQCATHARIRDHVSTAVENDEGNIHLGEFRVDAIRHAEELHHGAQPRLPLVPQRVAPRHGSLLRHLDGSVDEVRGRHDGPCGGESGGQGEDLR